MTVYLVTPTNGDPRVFLHLENAQKFLNYIKTDRHTQMGWIDSEGRHREILQNEDYHHLEMTENLPLVGLSILVVQSFTKILVMVRQVMYINIYKSYGG